MKRWGIGSVKAYQDSAWIPEVVGLIPKSDQ